MTGVEPDIEDVEMSASEALTFARKHHLGREIRIQFFTDNGRNRRAVSVKITLGAAEELLARELDQKTKIRASASSHFLWISI